MGLWDAVRTAVTGNRAPRPARLDDLFRVPTGTLAVEATLGWRATGTGAVCYRAADGAGFAALQTDVVDLLDADPDLPDVVVEVDGFGFSWLRVDRPALPGGAVDVGALATDLHAVNALLAERGFGPGLLCSTVVLAPPEGGPGRAALVYLFKQGTFYAFAPGPGRQRDQALETALHEQLAAELSVEPQAYRRLDLWGAPGL